MPLTPASPEVSFPRANTGSSHDRGVVPHAVKRRAFLRSAAALAIPGVSDLRLLRLRQGSGGQVAQRGRPFDVFEKTIAELQAAMVAGTVSSARLVELYLRRIEAFDRNGPRLNAVLALNPRAIEEARALDRERRQQGPRGPLHGIPALLKDNFDTRDLPTTGGCLALAGLVPTADAYQVWRLRDAGVILLGKVNLHELALGLTSVSSLGGQTLNPYDVARAPGGSSGGSG